MKRFLVLLGFAALLTLTLSLTNRDTVAGDSPKVVVELACNQPTGPSSGDAVTGIAQFPTSPAAPTSFGARCAKNIFDLLTDGFKLRASHELRQGGDSYFLFVKDGKDD